MRDLERLKEITDTLRNPGGCDWDREQTYSSLRQFLIEESYEVIDAVNRADYDHLREELGDVLFIVFFYARIAQEEGKFEIGDVAREVSDKLVRRHPHVFGDVKVKDVQEILSNWEEIKRTEKGRNKNDTGPRSILEKKEEFLPALYRAQKIQQKVAEVGFDWTEVSGVVDKVREELAEVEAEMVLNNDSISRAQKSRSLDVKDPTPNSESRGLSEISPLEEELGDLLFAVVNLTRHLGANPELSLQYATDKFIKRFQKVERVVQESDRLVKDVKLDELDEIWERIK